MNGGKTLLKNCILGYHEHKYRHLHGLFSYLPYKMPLGLLARKTPLPPNNPEISIIPENPRKQENPEFAFF